MLHLLILNLLLTFGYQPTIVCVGDSITVGGWFDDSGVKHITPWSVVIQQRFPGCRVINAGHNYDTAGMMLERFDRDVLSQHPDIVLILAGTASYLRQVPLETTERDLTAMYNRTYAAGATPFALTVPRYNSDDGGYRQQLNNWILANQRYGSVLSLNTEKYGHPEISSDRIHPRDIGHYLIARSLISQLSTLLPALR